MLIIPITNMVMQYVRNYLVYFTRENVIELYLDGGAD